MMNEMRKYWIFYPIVDEVYNVPRYSIYAFTDDPYIAQEFINTRNMSLFYMKKVKMNMREFSEMLRDNNLHRELVMMEEYTKDENNPSKLVKFSIPVTKSEMQFCKMHASILMHEKIFEFVWHDNKILKSKYRKALDTLLYSDFHELISTGDYQLPYSIKTDYFQILLLLYRDTFIKDIEEGDN